MKKLKKGKKLPKFISESQAVQMLATLNQNCVTGARNHAILMVMYRAGLRVSEVANLALSDIDFESGMIYVQGGKGGKDRYTVLDNAAMESCLKWLKFRPESEFFFCTMKGGVLDTRYIREMTYRISEKAGVFIQDGGEKKKVNPHAFRHGFATRALNELDMNIREVQQMLGHTNLNTTMIYTHVQPSDLAAKYRERSI